MQNIKYTTLHYDYIVNPGEIKLIRYQGTYYRSDQCKRQLFFPTQCAVILSKLFKLLDIDCFVHLANKSTIYECYVQNIIFLLFCDYEGIRFCYLIHLIIILILFHKLNSQPIFKKNVFSLFTFS